MPNRQLTPDELSSLFAPLLRQVRERLEALSGDDPDLLFALRRKLAKQLSYDERGTPMHRRLLKLQKRVAQANRCALCGSELPDKDVILERIEAMCGYAEANTRLLCRPCDYTEQEKRGFA